MQITKVEIFKAHLPLKRPFRIALGEKHVAGTVFVRIHSDQSIYGMGEANPFTPIVGETLATAFVAAEDLARLILGTDPLDIEGRVEQMCCPSQKLNRQALRQPFLPKMMVQRSKVAS